MATTLVATVPEPASPTQNGGNEPIMLTVRLIMQGKEVGSIIGKKGDHIKNIREGSGAKINISDGSCPERIVTITGTIDTIHKAFEMICNKFEEDLQNNQPQGVPRPPITFRLIMPASQCGSLIGKGGSKIKEIREITGASIQVASEMLPNSTERAVTVSGTSDALAQCIVHICQVMLETPPKGATIPYRPKPIMPPLIFAGGQAYTVPGQPQAMLPPEIAKIPQMAQMFGGPAMAAPAYITTGHPHHAAAMLPGNSLTGYGNGLYQQYMASAATTGVSEASLKYTNGIAAMNFGARPTVPMIGAAAHQSAEMVIPNDLIGCIIGRGGQKINEIRQLSGANIKIANIEEGSMDRKVTIMGTPETINMAQYLINTSMELHKNANLDLSTTPSTVATSSSGALSHSPQSSAAAAAVAGMTFNAAAGMAQQGMTQQQQQQVQAQAQTHAQPSPPLQHLSLPQMSMSMQALKPQALPFMGLAGLGYGPASPALAFDMNAYQKSLIQKLKMGMIATPSGAVAKMTNKFTPY